MTETKKKMWDILKTPHSESRLMSVNNFTLPDNVNAEVRHYKHYGEDKIIVYVDGAQLMPSQYFINQIIKTPHIIYEIQLYNYNFILTIRV